MMADLTPSFEEAQPPERKTKILFLGRKVGEWLKIGDDIYIGISRTTGQHVRLAVSAPDKQVIRMPAGEYPPGVFDITKSDQHRK